MQIENILKQMGTAFEMTGTVFLNVQTSWGCLLPPPLAKNYISVIVSP